MPSRLIVFEKAGHWPSAFEMALYYAAHLDWFHRYLGGAPSPWKPGGPRRRDVERSTLPCSRAGPPRLRDENRLARALAARTRPFLDLTVTNPTSVALRSGEADLFDGAASGRDARVLAALADPRGLVYAPDPKGISRRARR